MSIVTSAKCNARTTVAFVAFTTKNKKCETHGYRLVAFGILSNLLHKTEHMFCVPFVPFYDYFWKKWNTAF